MRSNYVITGLKKIAIILALIQFPPFVFSQPAEGCIGDYDSTLSVDVLEFAPFEPAYPGGFGEMSQFILKHVVYPQTMIEQGHPQSTVYVGFVVLEDGTLTAIHIRHTSEENYTLLDKEVLRVVSLMPKWIPGTCSGKAVNVRYTIPVQICLK